MARQYLVLLVILVLFSTVSSATTCIVGTKFTVHRVCGRVKDAQGTTIPNAIVQLKKQGQERIVAEANTSSDGTFALPNIASGDYEIRIKLAGFWDAAGILRVARPKKDSGCPHPIRVVMKPAGSCSYIENAWTEQMGRESQQQWRQNDHWLLITDN